MKRSIYRTSAGRLLIELAYGVSVKRENLGAGPVASVHLPALNKTLRMRRQRTIDTLQWLWKQQVIYWYNIENNELVVALRPIGEDHGQFS